MKNSRIFLSPKGANRPLIDKVDQALRLLGLKTWFDRDDLNACDTLVRGVDNALAECSAAVFFLSGQFADEGVIQCEIIVRFTSRRCVPNGSGSYLLCRLNTKVLMTELQPIEDACVEDC